MPAALLILLSAMVLAGWSQASSARSLPDFTELVEDNAGAVVNISTTTEPTRRNSGAPGMPFDERQLEQLPEFFQD
ncbi:MAG TPA: serine peptidase, partial [Marinobacter adhaerens]|nr:serine peptidase [Marinobacter adhaerens]